MISRLFVRYSPYVFEHTIADWATRRPGYSIVRSTPPTTWPDNRILPYRINLPAPIGRAIRFVVSKLNKPNLVEMPICGGGGTTRRHSNAYGSWMVFRTYEEDRVFSEKLHQTALRIEQLRREGKL